MLRFLGVLKVDLDKPSKEQNIKIFYEVNFAGFTKTQYISNVKCILNVFILYILFIFSYFNGFILQGSDISLYFDMPNMEPELKQN